MTSGVIITVVIVTVLEYQMGRVAFCEILALNCCNFVYR